MATGQDILNQMEVLNQELQLQPGEADVSRGLIALNIAQDYFENLAAARKGLLGDQTGTVTTTASTETTAFPTGVLRIDRLQRLDDSTSRPKYDLLNIKGTGGHAASGYWPWYLVSTMTNGEVGAYYTNGRNIYWAPIPQSVYTIRWYGFQRASDITAAGTFAYDDGVMTPLATFATQVLKTGVDDPAQELSGLATTMFTNVLDMLQNFNRDTAPGFMYTERHLT